MKVWGAGRRRRGPSLRSVQDTARARGAVYNEIDPFAATWLENLIAAGHIAPGTVDRRSIVELRPEDVKHATQAHFFAGIAAWSYALRLAGWPDGVPVWTGSCPCQPLSDAGKRLGFDDDRHLWPAWFHLVRECRPPIIFGEQVASSLGLAWLDLVRVDLEDSGYAFGAADLCAAGVGAPHKRQRLFFVAIADGWRFPIVRTAHDDHRRDAPGDDAHRRGEARELGDPEGAGHRRREDAGADRGASREGEAANNRRTSGDREPARAGQASALGDAAGGGRASERDGAAPEDRTRSVVPRELARGPEGPGRDGGAVADAEVERRAARRPGGSRRDPSIEPERHRDGGVADTDVSLALDGEKPRGRRLVQPAEDAAPGFWDACDWICSDGVARPVEPGTFPLAHGAPARVGRLRAYGNAIVSEAARVFIESVIDVLEGAPA